MVSSRLKTPRRSETLNQLAIYRRHGLFAVTKSGVSLELDRWQATSPNEIPSGFPTDFSKNDTNWKSRTGLRTERRLMK